jgi:hypothetical protein
MKSLTAFTSKEKKLGSKEIVGFMHSVASVFIAACHGCASLALIASMVGLYIRLDNLGFLSNLRLCSHR